MNHFTLLQNTLKVTKKSKVCVVSHDAGGAEILASYVARNELDSLFVLAGPAIKVFERRMGKIKITNLEEALMSCDWCLCSTSWQSDLEWKAIRQARDAHKHVVVFLDHWVNYRERFIRQGIEHLPDEIWVGDVYAQNMASQIFLDIPIKLVKNTYFKDIQEQLKKHPHKKSAKATEVTVLCVCEPIADHALKTYGDERYWGYTEHDALEYFLENISVLNEEVKKVIIRPHPSEPLGKYSYVREKFCDLTIDLGVRRTLLEEISQSHVVVGCETMAMVIGLLAQKRVISCIPPEGKPCSLPQTEIEYLAELIKIHEPTR
ncbi:hypothetical protein NEA10_13840 [Phormidium yuhuli AB48]|uniref:Capsule polysaccharide biosynthesis protein n=1 Tax=Phormidium yuhuli AB48 TaxID=2940671 RepID=A0ABY5AM71_9CYAN|nr:hypothetical protein [Phormidium yuhuli]USR89932.1 hypothetical protein NEA10_13840 [Phormidium yuhuli AB48]